MSNKAIQFQEGMSLYEFYQKYGSEQQCRDALFELRWPQGFVCPSCGYDNGGFVSMLSLRASDFFDIGDNLSLDKVASYQVVPWYLFYDPEQKWNFRSGAEASPGNRLQNRLENETKNDACNACAKQ